MKTETKLDEAIKVIEQILAVLKKHEAGEITANSIRSLVALRERLKEILS